MLLFRDYNQEEIQDFFEIIDEDGTGSISFIEFCKLINCVKEISADQMRVKQIMEMTVRELGSMFELFDLDKGGRMSMTEMGSVLHRVGRKPTNAELAEMCGRPGEGESLDFNKIELTFCQFVQMISGTQTKAQRGLRRMLREFREVFELFDESNDGVVDAEEFLETLKIFGKQDQKTKVLVAQIVHDYANEKGDVDYFSFLAMMASGTPQIEESLKTQLVGFRHSFRIFDADNNGSVTFDEFVQAWRRFGFESPEDEVKKLLDMHDTTNVTLSFALASVITLYLET